MAHSEAGPSSMKDAVEPHPFESTFKSQPLLLSLCDIDIEQFVAAAAAIENLRDEDDLCDLEEGAFLRYHPAVPKDPLSLSDDSDLTEFEDSESDTNHEHLATAPLQPPSPPSSGKKKKKKKKKTTPALMNHMRLNVDSDLTELEDSDDGHGAIPLATAPLQSPLSPLPPPPPPPPPPPSRKKKKKTRAKGNKRNKQGESTPLVPPSPLRSKPVFVTPSRTDKRNMRRTTVRKIMKAQATVHTKKIKSSFSRKHSGSTIRRLQTSFLADKLTTANGSWIGLNGNVRGLATHAQSLIRRGYKYIQWRGTRPEVILDKLGRVIAVLAGRPVDDPTWAETMREFEELVNLIKSMVSDTAAFRTTKSDRRGPHKGVHMGASYGGGQRQPGVLCHDALTEEALNIFRASPHAIRIATFASMCLAFYAPKLYKSYSDGLLALHEHFPTLPYNFDSSIFPAASINFPPDVACNNHVDFANRAAGWCSIYAGGNFNPKTGGHLVLPQLKLVIEFPAGSTILLPSATLQHGNVKVPKSQTRFSFVQYAAGGLFRYVYYGFRTLRVLKEEDDAFYRRMLKARKDRKAEELALFSKLENLHADRKAAGLLY